MNVLIPLEKVNKDYQLPFERVYGWTKMNNHGFSKESMSHLIFIKMKVNSDLTNQITNDG
jgi:hypothetical protein